MNIADTITTGTKEIVGAVLWHSLNMSAIVEYKIKIR